MSAPYRDCIFDMDGTLTQPGLIDFAAIKDAIGCPRDETIIEFLYAVRGAELRRAWQVIEANERAAVAHLRPNAHVHTVLGALHIRGVRCFVLTRNSRAITRATLHALGIGAYIRDSICREDSAPKPHPAGIHALRERWSFDPRRTLMVGDFHFDVLTGAAAGVATAFLTNRNETGPTVRFPTGHPTHVVHDLRGLLPLF